MTAIVDKAACEAAGAGQEGGLLPVSPFTALQFHFGMLLGVDDLETSQAYPRGKIRLHNAWLHREGVVWGFSVYLNARKELAVDPGLALDAAGHELHLEVPACLDLGKWYATHKNDAGLVSSAGRDGTQQFSVHVVAKFTACLTRPVPAIADPCAGAEIDTAYSRAFETVELLLRPGPAPRKTLPYHRLRILFGLEDAGPPDKDVPPRKDSPPYSEATAQRTAILALPPDQQPRAYLKAFRTLAAFDEIDLAPEAGADGNPDSIFPEDPTEVVLADVINVTVMPAGDDGWTIAAPLPTVDVTVRPSHVATATIQELLCGPTFGNAGPPVDAGGPRIDPRKVEIVAGAKQITLFATARLSINSAVEPQAYSVASYSEEGGWNNLEIGKVKLDDAGTTITLVLKDAVPKSSALIRVIARGSGEAPILGDKFVPLAGAVGGPAGSENDGNDFVLMLRRN
jgi:hypothetical protein